MFVPLASLTIAALALVASRFVGIETLLFGSAALAGAIATLALAYRWPLATIALGLVFGQVLGQEAQLLLPAELRSPQIGTLQLRYFDPFLFGIVGATAIRGVQYGRRAMGLAKLVPALALLLAWLVFQVGRGAVTTGAVQAMGEFRTYYQHLLLVPYVALSFRTERVQMTLFRVLTVIALGFLPLSIVLGWLLSGLSIGPSSRWLSSSANLATLIGLVALIIGTRYRMFQIGQWATWIAAVAFAIITLLNSHRSVWAAAAVAVVALVVLRVLPVNRLLGFGVAVTVGLAAAAAVFPGGQAELLGYVETRAVAFTDFERDPTANWRYTLWRQVADELAERPLLGRGLGPGFDLVDPSGMAITTSPHNAYLTIAYHTGAIGLLLYVAFALQVLTFALRAMRSSDNAHKKSIGILTTVILGIAHTYYVAYAFDYMTWLLVGLAIACFITTRSPTEGRDA